MFAFPRGLQTWNPFRNRFRRESLPAGNLTLTERDHVTGGEQEQRPMGRLKPWVSTSSPLMGHTIV